MTEEIEEITDIIEDLKKRYTKTNFKKMKIKKGKVLSFSFEGSPVVLEVTKVTVDGRYFAKHIQLHEPTAVSSHIRHNVDATDEAQAEHGAPWCSDCEVVITELATPKGKRRFEARKERYLSDGTLIDSEPEETQLG